MKDLLSLLLLLCISISVSAQSLKKVKKDGQWGMTSSTGETVIPFEYDSLKYFSYGLIAALKGDKWGFIDKKNVVAIPFQFDEVKSFEYSASVVTKDDKKGLINLKGETILALVYELLYISDNEYIIYKKDDTAGLMDTLGQKVSPVYQDIDFFNKGKISIKKDGKWGSWKDGVENMNDDYLLFSGFDLMAVFSDSCSKDYQREVEKLLNKKESYIIADNIIEEIKTCSENSLIKYVYTNIIYPSMARENGIEGLTMVNFVVKADGSVTDIQILQNIGGGCAEAVKTVLEVSPKWFQPAIKDHQKVNSVYKLPVRFRLTNPD